MSDKACRTDHVFWNDETPDEKLAHRFPAENSQAASWDNSEAEGDPKERQEELQNSPEKKADSMKQKNQAGIFSGLRKRLRSRIEKLTAKRTTTSVRAISISSDVEVGGEGTCMKHTKRAPYYRCVPYPPGCIPTEVMIRVEDVFYSPPLNLPGKSERPAAFDGTNHKEADETKWEQNLPRKLFDKR